MKVLKACGFLLLGAVVALPLSMLNSKTKEHDRVIASTESSRERMIQQLESKMEGQSSLDKALLAANT